MVDQRLQQALSALRFERSEVWDLVMGELAQFTEGETSQALDAQTVGEARIHQCGRASALADFKEHLEYLREEARKHIDN